MIQKWDNDEIQFARLLCEIAANSDFLNLEQIALSMDISLNEINELFDRAQTVFELSKREII